MLKYVLLSAVSVLAMTAIAQAAPIFDNGNVSIFLDQNTFPAAGEAKIFLDADTNVTLGHGQVGSQTGAVQTNFETNVPVDLANGFATITPHNKDDVWNSMTFSIPNHNFTDFLWDSQLTNPKDKSAELNFEIKVFSGLTLLADLNLTNTGDKTDKLKKDTDQSWMVLADGNKTITSVILSSATSEFAGFNEQKHFQVSGVPVPATLPLALGGFGMLGGFIWRRNRQRKASQC
jgi:hypothetical protein